MSFGAEVTGKLGIDTASVPADLERAKAAMQKFGQESAGIGAKAGDETGLRMAGAIEHHFIGNRAIASALGTALGLNITEIAHGITAAIVGGTKQAWEEAIKIADESTKIIEELIAARLSPKGKQEQHKRDLKDALEANAVAVAPTNFEKIAEAAIPKTFGGGLMKNMLVTFGLVRSEAEKLVQTNKTNEAVIVAGAKVEADRREGKEADKKLTESIVHANLTGLNTTEKIAALEAEKAALTKQQESGKLTIVEIDDRARRIGEIDREVQQEKNDAIQREIDQKNELLRLQTSLGEVQRKMAEDEEAMANKKADRGKQTVDEIAKIKPKEGGRQFGEDTHVDTFGLSAEASEAKEQAVAIQRQQKEAERLRSQGDVAGANQLFDQVGAGKQKLVDSGFAKSTEGDEFKKMAEAIHKDNVELQRILGEIKVIAAGKLKNQ